MAKRIFCVIPALNEESNIFSAVASAKEFVDEVVVVDDGSSDNTVRKAKEAGATVLRHAFNRGQGAALETGNMYAAASGADIIVHFDGDGQFDAEEIADVTMPILDGSADAVFGSRFLGKHSGMPFSKRWIIIPLGKLFNRIFLGVDMTDPQSGFRALSSEAVRTISIENDGMAHCSEILSKAHKNGLRIKEVPITVTYHEFGQRFGGGLKIIKDLFLANMIK